MEHTLLQYGVLGVALIALAWFVLKLMKDHKEERNEWREGMEKQFDKMEKNDREHYGLLKEIKQLLREKNDD